MDELHEYASDKVQEESPEMTPRFYPVEQGYRIHIARSPQGNPKLKYRKEVEAIIQNEQDEIDFLRGEIDEFEREILEIYRLEYGISIEDTEIIEKEVMELHHERWKKLQQYKTLFTEAVEKSFPLRKNDRLNLERIQKRLSLRDEDVRRIEAKITSKISQPKTIKKEPGKIYKKEPQKYKRDEITRKKTKEEEEYEKWKSDKEFHQQLIKNSILRKW